MKTNTEIAEEIFNEAYQGVANSINWAIQDWEDKNGSLDSKVLWILDDLGFDCVNCSNVCEISELSGKEHEEMVCENCEDEY